jgi:hypothetical protein
MGRPTPQTQTKRRREQKKREKSEAKREAAALRRAQKKMGEEAEPSEEGVGEEVEERDG